MDTALFEGLREQVRDRTHTPDLKLIFHTGRRRRRIRRTAFGAGLAVVAAIGIAVPTLIPHPATQVTASPTGHVPIKGPLQATVSTENCLGGVEAFSTTIAFGQTCMVDRKGTGLSVTTDAGQHWQNWVLPAAYQVVPPHTGTQSGGPMVLDDQTVLFGNLITKDRGQTWKEIPPEPGAPIDAVPTGWKVYAGQLGHQPNATAQMYAIDPATGTFHPLTDAPAFTPEVKDAVTEAANGSLWAGVGMAAISQDRGRSWSTLLPPGRSAQTRVLVSSVDGRTGYALLIETGSNNPSVLLSTTDGGGHWARVQTGRLAQIAALADGSLLAIGTTGTGASQLLLSRDGGRTFMVLSGHPVGDLKSAAGGYAVLSGSQKIVQLTKDARTFSTVTIPG